MPESVRLYRVKEITKPGTLPAGRYIAVRGGRVLVEVELPEPTRPRDLIPLITKRDAA